MRSLLPLALLLIAPNLSGCLLWLASGDPSCPNDGIVSDGNVSVGEEERSPVMSTVDLDADPTGSCIHHVFINLDLGQGCSVGLRADGPMDSMAIYDVSIFGEEGCGLPDTGFSVVDYGESTISVDGNLFSVGGDDSVCFDGSVDVELDLVLEEDEVLVSLTGSVTGEGIELAWFDPGNCDD